MPVTVDKDTCIGCGACVGVSPVVTKAYALLAFLV